MVPYHIPRAQDNSTVSTSIESVESAVARGTCIKTCRNVSRCRPPQGRGERKGQRERSGAEQRGGEGKMEGGRLGEWQGWTEGEGGGGKREEPPHCTPLKSLPDAERHTHVSLRYHNIETPLNSSSSSSSSAIQQLSGHDRTCSWDHPCGQKQ